MSEIHDEEFEKAMSEIYYEKDMYLKDMQYEVDKLRGLLQYIADNRFDLKKINVIIEQNKELIGAD